MHKLDEVLAALKSSDKSSNDNNGSNKKKKGVDNQPPVFVFALPFWWFDKYLRAYEQVTAARVDKEGYTKKREHNSKMNNRDVITRKERKN